MAQIRRYPILKHLRAEPTNHVLNYRGGKLVKSEPGLSFWFHPLSTSVAEIPIDDREQAFLFTGRTSDFQEVIVQGTVTYRIADPQLIAERIDFGIDLENGLYRKEPMERLSAVITQLAQQFALGYIENYPLRSILEDGVENIRQRVEQGLMKNVELENQGLEVIAIRISTVSPTQEMEKALQAPTRESIQQRADQATFERRALAVKKERAIAENELQNKIELSRQEQSLIEQRGQNERRRASEEAEAKRIEALANVERVRLNADAQADSISAIEAARNQAEQEKMNIYRHLPPSVVLGLAAQQLASNLHTIEHLNLSPDALGSMLTTLLSAGTRKLEEDS